MSDTYFSPYVGASAGVTVATQYPARYGTNRYYLKGLKENQDPSWGANSGLEAGLRFRFNPKNETRFGLAVDLNGGQSWTPNLKWASFGLRGGALLEIDNGKAAFLAQGIVKGSDLGGDWNGLRFGGDVGIVEGWRVGGWIEGVQTKVPAGIVGPLDQKLIKQGQAETDISVFTVNLNLGLVYQF